ncbi:MAG: ATP-binding cassette domain-containing protein [Candidatus Thermoplasmatota archaeon]|nr:ATP-binding cassette domain-containing protein [Candidatus Thermoplasmatota archaeon]
MTINVDITGTAGILKVKAEINGSGLILLTGRNGSGKTTILRMIAGQVSIQSGSIVLNGKDVTFEPLNRRRIVFINHDSVLSELTVDSHIRWSRSNTTDEEVSLIKEKMGVNFSGKVKDLSLGQRMRVSIASAILSRPGAILLDETLANISEKSLVLENVRTISREKNIDFIVASQITIPEIAWDASYVVENGITSKIAD